MKKQSIMIVDDEERLVSNITKIFEQLGSTVLRASRGKEALDLLKKIEVDVILLDVNMPGMNGFETLAAIKKRHPLVEVIMITGTFSRKQAAEGLRLGAYDFVLKPVNISDLVTKADEAFNKRKAMEEKLRKVSEQVDMEDKDRQPR
jgi:DNA-binding NtrC family response regulator